MLEHVEHLDQHDTAGGRQRHRNDIIAAIGAGHRFADDGLIGPEIVRCHQPAGALYRGSDFFRNVALVERARTARGDRLQCRGEIGLHHHLAGMQRRVIGMKEDLL